MDVVRYALFGLMLLGATVSRAGQAEVGKPFPPYALPDAFGRTNRLNPSTRFVIVASEKDVSMRINAWLAKKGQEYLPTHAAEYVSDITPMPAIILALFARPKMRKYPFTILLARDEQFARTYPRQPGKIALFVLDEQQVLREIRHLDEPDEAGALLARPGT